MNSDHLELLTSDTWRTMLREQIIPFALGAHPLADLGNDVLEVGPGPGATTDLLAAELEHLTALELDPDLAATLRHRTRASDTISVVEGDASDMPFESGRFSATVSFTMLHHVGGAEVQDQTFREICRVLRPGGLFIASDSIASEELAALHVDDTYNPVDPTSLEDRLARAGFVDVDIDSNAFGWRSHAYRPRA